MRKKLSLYLIVLALLSLLVSQAALAEGDGTVTWDKWTANNGGWKIEGYVNADGKSNPITAYAAVDQNGPLVTVEWTVQFIEHTFSLGPAAGVHIMADASDPTKANSYLIFQDNGFIRLYRGTGSQLAKNGDFPATAADGDQFTYKVEFNTKTGAMKIYRDNQLFGEWTDPNPLTSGKYLILRTNGTIASFKEVKVSNQ
ncbi:MAG TPA: hypothetical protein GXX29_04885 [Firmicutes bacterium]|nr:hypothetical protein [Bacillota bacterium]